MMTTCLWFFLVFSSLKIQVAFTDNLKFLLDFFRFYQINQVDAYLCNKFFDNRKDFIRYFSRNLMQISVQNVDGTICVDNHLQYNHRGIIIDPNCTGAPFLMEEAANNHLLTGINHVIFWSTEEADIEDAIPDWGMDFLNETEIYLNSEVMWAQKNSNTSFVLFDIYRIRLNRTIQSSKLGIYPEMSVQEILSEIEPSGRRRKDFQNILLLARVVIQFPKEFTYIDDVRRRHIDPFTKWNFPTAKLLAEDLNFRYQYSIIDNFGWRNESGDFDGLMGLFQRKEIDFGMLGVLMRTDRIDIIDFTAETVGIETRLMFRKPPLSSLSNIYLLPFHSSVWLASAVICITTEIVYLVVVWFENTKETRDQRSRWTKFLDTISLLVGAICQQGISEVPLTISSRIVVLFAFVTSIFLYTSYAANIVALLQTPSTAIKTVEDVINSPLTLAVHSTTYNRIFLKVELSFAYEYMSHHYLEDEKCDLSEIELYRLPMQTIPVQKHSPYRDIFKQRLLWQREVGITDRKNGLWVPKKPKCDSTQSRYVSVGLIEFMPAIRVLLYGALCALILFIMESLLSWQHKKLRQKHRKDRDKKN